MQSSFTFTLQTVFYSFQKNSRKTCIVSWIWCTFLSFLHRIFSELLPVFLRTGTMNKLRPSLLNNWAFKLQQTGLACMGDCKTLSTSSKKTNNTGRGSTLLSFMLCPFSESGLNQCQCLSVKLIQYDFVVLNNLCYLFVFFSIKKRIMKPNGNVIPKACLRARKSLRVTWLGLNTDKHRPCFCLFQVADCCWCSQHLLCLGFCVLEEDCAAW